MLQCDWLRAFCSISQEHRIANNINFYYRTNAVKINDQIFKFKKSIFDPFSGDKKSFSKKTRHCHAQLTGFQHHVNI